MPNIEVSRTGNLVKTGWESTVKMLSEE